MKLLFQIIFFEDDEEIFQYVPQRHVRDTLFSVLSYQALASPGTSSSGVTTAHNKCHEEGFLGESGGVFGGWGRKMQEQNSFPGSRTPHY